MMSPPVSQILSAEYEVYEGRQLVQGDIIERVTVYDPANPAKPLGAPGEEAIFLTKERTIAIVTQTCDMVEGQPGTLDMILVSPVWKLSESAAFDSRMGSPFYRDICRRGMVYGVHMIPESKDAKFPRETSVVNFREVWSLPLSYVRAQAEAKGPRLRLRPPFREDLAQCFARFFMRIALDPTIPAFADKKEEQKIFDRLSNLDSASRERILAAFRV